jgi:MoxR-like ATPase
MYEDEKTLASSIVAEVGKEIFGLDEVTRLSLVALFSEGHVLLEGNPGFGKTELVKRLAGVLGLDYGRIQFTPDLMPSDITGTYMPDLEGSGRFAFTAGPIFTQLLLADEINRATPKTQSAMLEGMAEHQVTVLGEKHRLPEPFMVLATQNPIDHEGTYDLPEAQSDRFMFKILMPGLDEVAVRKIMTKTAGVPANPGSPDDSPKVVLGDPAQAKKKIAGIRRRILAMSSRPSVEAHIVNIVQASNHRYEDVKGLSRDSLRQARSIVENGLAYGLGPRAATALLRGAKAWSLLFEPGAAHAVPEGLARVALPVLRHRIKLELDWQRRIDPHGSATTTNNDQEPDDLIADLVVATAPEDEGHRNQVTRVLKPSRRG